MMDVYIVHGWMDSSCGFLRSWPSYFCEGSRMRFRVFLSSFPNPSQREAPFFLTSLPRFPPFWKTRPLSCGFAPPQMLGRRGTELLEAAARGQEARARQLLAAGADPTWRQPQTGPGPGGVVRGGRGERAPPTVAAVMPRFDRPACGGPQRPRGGRPRAAAARGGSGRAPQKRRNGGGVSSAKEKSWPAIEEAPPRPEPTMAGEPKEREA